MSANKDFGRILPHSRVMAPYLSLIWRNELFRICTKPTLAITLDSVELEPKFHLQNEAQIVWVIKSLKTEPVDSLTLEKNPN